MTGCSAPNCSNHSKNGFKFYRFPSDPVRRKMWLINCRRKDWIPTQNDRLCSEHFEESQIEQGRADGKKRLKPFAVPTIFDVPNPPKLINSTKSLYKRCKENEPAYSNVQANKRLKIDENNDTNCTLNTKSLSCEDVSECPNVTPNDEILQLKKKCAQLEEEIKLKNNALAKFLTQEQCQILSIERKCIKKWSHEGIIKGLKLRFALGKNGYNFLRETGYPAPSYSTLNKRISSVKLKFGLFHAIVDLLAKKVESMHNIEKDCSLMVDEMEISGDLDFDKSKKSFIGQVTLGDTNKKGNHLTVVALRGLNTSWKQIIACHVTGPSTNGSDMKKLILEIIQAVTLIGLNIRSICSDMGSNNKALWVSLGINVNRDQRIISFTEDSSNRQIYVLADAPHLLKNWKSAIQRSKIFLPMEVVLENHLPTNVVTGKYITDLWNHEMKNKMRLRFLHHLTEEIITPGHFSKMNVGNAMRYISIKTAGALETAVIQKILPHEALTTAWFIRLIRQWFELINSRRRVASVTLTNVQKKKEFMNYFVSIIEQVIIDKGWKPLNTGSILTSLSFMKLAEECFERKYKFLLESQLSQDALENIFSQIRKRAGMKPSALNVLKVIKLICLSQFMSDTKNTNYLTDSDMHLLDYCQLGRIENNNGIKMTSYTA